eukprot:1826994-Prymnesium_polylepis.1
MADANAIWLSVCSRFGLRARSWQVAYAQAGCPRQRRQAAESVHSGNWHLRSGKWDLAKTEINEPHGGRRWNV